MAARYCAKRDVESVSAVDGNKCESQVSQFLFGELFTRLVVHLIRHAILSYQRHCLGPGQRRPFKGDLVAAISTLRPQGDFDIDPNGLIGTTLKEAAASNRNDVECRPYPMGYLDS